MTAGARPGGFGTLALGVAALTLTARIVGFGRSVVFSKTVGDTCLGDTYNAANLLPNVLFEIVAGGVLAGVVIPVVARHVGAERRSSASESTSALITWTMLVLTPAAVVAFFAARSYAAAFDADACTGGAATLAALVAIFVPQIWLYGLAVVSAGVLQAHGRFLAAAVAPLLSSMVVITAYLVFSGIGQPQARADLSLLSSEALGVLGWGTTLGVAALALATVIPLSRLGLRLRPRLRFADGDKSVVLKFAAAGVAGLVVQQLSLLLVSWAAKHTHDPGALTRYTWANAIYLLPYAVLVGPLLQMSFPRLSAAAERGGDAVAEVLADTAPPVIVLASLGSALLAATAIPVARVFVLGPGSGRTDALAWPIIAFAPAVVGFALLGLATRALLAQRQATSAGAATVTAWSAVIVAVLVLRSLVGDAWLVTALGAAVSFGMIVGACVGWVLLRRSGVTSGPPTRESNRQPGGRRSAFVAVAAALVAGTLLAWLSRGLLDAGIVAASAGAVGCAAGATVVFGLLVFVLDRRLLGRVWRLLRRGSRAVEVP